MNMYHEGFFTAYTDARTCFFTEESLNKNFFFQQTVELDEADNLFELIEVLLYDSNQERTYSFVLHMGDPLADLLLRRMILDAHELSQNYIYPHFINILKDVSVTYTDTLSSEDEDLKENLGQFVSDQLIGLREFYESEKNFSESLKND